jgi:hypothetical protein
MKTQLNEIKRMQQLAGLLNEAVDFNDWYWDNNHGMNILFKTTPANPNDILTQHDEEYIDPNDPKSKNFTKEDFWKTDVMDSPKTSQGFYDFTIPTKANKLPNGTWNFLWDSGEISGFVEGEDFEFVPEGKL